MALRDDFYQHFGPKLLEGILDYLYDNIAQLRTAAGLGPITKEQMLEGISNHLSSLPDYDWMSEEP